MDLIYRRKGGILSGGLDGGQAGVEFFWEDDGRLCRFVHTDRCFLAATMLFRNDAERGSSWQASWWVAPWRSCLRAS